MENLIYDYDACEEPESKYEIIDGKEYGEIAYEIIGGEKVLAPAPTLTHSTIVSRISHIFWQYIDNNEIKAMVYGDNTDVYFSKKDHYRPDVSIVCDETIIANGKRVIGAPDLIVEVLSDSTRKNDFGKKKDVYEKYGVKEYWIVDPDDKSIKVFHRVDNKFEFNSEYKLHTDKNKIKVSIFDGLTVDVSNIFKFLLN